MITTLLIFFIIVVVINALPVFPVPTWLVIYYYYSFQGVDLISCMLIAVIASTIGRSILAIFSNKLLKLFPSKQLNKNLDFVKNIVDKYRYFAIPLIAIYCALPVPSNLIYIPAGQSLRLLTQVNIGHIIGRILNYSYSLWIAITVTKVSANLISTNLSDTNSILSSIGLLIISVIVLFVDYESLILDRKFRIKFG